MMQPPYIDPTDLILSQAGNLKSGVYYYAVVACRDELESNLSNTIKVFVPRNGYSIGLAWEDINKSTTGYRLYRGTEQGVFENQIFLYGNKNYFVDSGTIVWLPNNLEVHRDG